MLSIPMRTWSLAMVLIVASVLAALPVNAQRRGGRPQFDVLVPDRYDSRFTAGYNPNGDGDFTDPGEWLPFAPGAISMWGQPSGYAVTGQTLMTQAHGVTASVPPLSAAPMDHGVPVEKGSGYPLSFWNCSTSNSRTSPLIGL